MIREMYSQECVCANCKTAGIAVIVGPESPGRPDKWDLVSIDGANNGYKLLCDTCIAWLRQGLETARELMVLPVPDSDLSEDELKSRKALTQKLFFGFGQRTYIPVPEEIIKARAQAAIRRVEEKEVDES